MNKKFFFKDSLHFYFFKYEINCLVSVKHNWEVMVEAIQNYIGSLNWGYRVSLREKSVTYLNSYGEFVEPHKIKVSSVFKTCNWRKSRVLKLPFKIQQGKGFILDIANLSQLKFKTHL